jgi:hypothetical protein
VLPFLRPATRPHAFCEAVDLLLDLSRAQTQISCLRNRPGYNCQKPDFRQYDEGSLQLACTATPAFSLQRFSVDHHRDLFAGLQFESRNTATADVTLDQPVLLIARENGEYANLFHAMSDVVSAVSVLYMTGMEPADVRVLLLDDHPTGPYDDVWSVFGNAPALRLADFESKRVLLRHAVMVPPGYSSLLLAVEHVRPQCDRELDVLRAFRAVVLGGLAIRPGLPFGVECVGSAGRVEQDCGQTTLQPDDTLVTIIARRPYEKFVEHSFMGRMIANEPELLAAVTAAAAPARVVMVDLAMLSFRDQLSLAARTDLLVGMHGAGLAHSLFLPSHAGTLFAVVI